LTVALKEGSVASTPLVLDVEVFKSSAVPSWGMTSISTGYLVWIPGRWVIPGFGGERGGRSM